MCPWKEYWTLRLPSSCPVQLCRHGVSALLDLYFQVTCCLHTGTKQLGQITMDLMAPSSFCVWALQNERESVAPEMHAPDTVFSLELLQVALALFPNHKWSSKFLKIQFVPATCSCHSLLSFFGRLCKQALHKPSLRLLLLQLISSSPTDDTSSKCLTFPKL